MNIVKLKTVAEISLCWFGETRDDEQYIFFRISFDLNGTNGQIEVSTMGKGQGKKFTSHIPDITDIKQLDEYWLDCANCVADSFSIPKELAISACTSVKLQGDMVIKKNQLS
jgi:acid phosphatase class B